VTPRASCGADFVGPHRNSAIHGTLQDLIAIIRIIVPMTDTTMEPRQPSRFENNANMFDSPDALDAVLGYWS
jgi:hypothetical protein